MNRRKRSLKAGFKRRLFSERNIGAFISAASRFPFAGKLHPWLKEEKTDMRWLPINDSIEAPDNSPMPVELLYRLIDEASHRVIVEYCGCRKAFKCKSYPAETGCLMMGESALEIEKYPVREVGREEAKEHVEKAAENGLIPIVGKARVDNYLFKVKDKKRLLTVCFCCECCCITRYTRFTREKQLDSLLKPLEGIRIEVLDTCTGCGECANHCFIDAIRIIEGKAEIGNYCRSCARCARFCKEKAIRVSIDEADFLEKEYRRIREYVKFD